MKRLFFKGRIIIQAIFVVLLLLGLHRTINPVLVLFMPLALIAGIFSVAGYVHLEQFRNFWVKYVHCS